MNWEKDYQSKIVSIQEAVIHIKSGDCIFVPGGASAPVDLLNALAERRLDLQDCTVHTGLAMYPFEFLKPEYKGHIKWQTFFSGPLERKFKPFGNVEMASVPFSKFEYYVKDVIKPTVLMAEVSAPDKEGYMNYGPVGVGLNEVARECADTVIVQVNKHVPFIYGEKNTIHVSQVNYICERDHLLADFPWLPATDEDKKIAEYILPYIPDGATIQIGIGGVANAVGYGLEGKKDLGIYSEVLTPSIIYLAEKGVITNSKKNYLPGKMIFAFGVGDQNFYKYIDKNPVVHFAPVYVVNNPETIAKNDNLISINNAMMVDLNGQVASEAFGFNVISGTGGQLDFVRGATRSKGGKSFLALSSAYDSEKGKQSRIVLSMPPGTAVTVPRADVQYVVTEYGVADLYVRSISERANALIKIAHPDFREQLTQDAKKAGLF